MSTPAFNSRSLALALTLMFFSASPGFAQTTLRMLSANDLFQLVELGQTAISPDGRWMAFVLLRRKSVSPVHARPFLEGNDRGDVWLVSTSGGNPQNLTNGESDGSGWWAPLWAPDGERLALLSTRGGNLRLWQWERASRRLKPLTKEAVDLLIGEPAPFVWFNNQQLACATLPKGHKPNPMTLEMRASEIATREWPKAWRGQKSTVSVLESGIPQPLSQRPPGQLLLVDVLKGNRRLATGFSFRELRLSPDRQHIAVLEQTEVLRPDPAELLVHGRFPAVYRAVVVNRNGRESLFDIDTVKDVDPGSLRWSPDGNSLALLRRTSSDRLQAVTCTLTSKKCQTLHGLEYPVALSWSGKGTLLAQTRPDPMQSVWWVEDSAARRINLTENLSAPFRELLLEASGQSLIGISAGDLWRVNVDGSGAKTLTDDFEPRITSILWPRTADNESLSVTQLILSVRRGTNADWILFDLTSRKVVELPKPKVSATIRGYDPRLQTVIIAASDRTGTYLWLSQAPFEKLTTVVEANIQLRKIAQAEFKKIEYKSSEGKDLKGWVLLPVGYRPEVRYPVITVVYAGTVFGDDPPRLGASINSSSALNYQLLAAHGYAVLFPSMPLEPAGGPSDPYLELTKGVLPAVDKIVEQGIADPKRLGLLGQSYGGYSVYGLIAQTNRFKAAVALAGIGDLISMYGTFDARFRYDQFSHERVMAMAQTETGPMRMGNPPWKDHERYLRNSPLSYVDRIETPLMIVQGDQDFVALQQGEQIFTALYRQKKRAAFARYWGEGHVLQSPPNVRDMWERIFRWFDGFLSTEDTATLKAAPGVTEVNNQIAVVPNFLPFYHFGFRSKLPLNDKVTVMYHLINGAQQSEDFNGSRSLLLPPSGFLDR
jgi:dipeptidyl aminopeptidase/acylaminoacyl peptidase